MLAQWTAELIGEMHLSGITARELAREVQWHEKYLSAVLNGHRQPKGAEEKLRRALQALQSARRRADAPDSFYDATECVR